MACRASPYIYNGSSMVNWVPMRATRLKPAAVIAAAVSSIMSMNGTEALGLERTYDGMGGVCAQHDALGATGDLQAPRINSRVRSHRPAVLRVTKSWKSTDWMMSRALCKPPSWRLAPSLSRG